MIMPYMSENVFYRLVAHVNYYFEGLCLHNVNIVPTYPEPVVRDWIRLARDRRYPLVGCADCQNRMDTYAREAFSLNIEEWDLRNSNTYYLVRRIRREMGNPVLTIANSEDPLGW
jgi:hypothetical protein